MDVIVSGLNHQAESLALELESPDPEGLDSFRKLLEMYSFLLLWVITSAESLGAQKSITGAKENIRGRPKAKQSTVAKEQTAPWDCTPQLQTAFEVMCKVLKLKLAKVWTLTSERDTFVRYSIKRFDGT
jgi:condensin complex subunit 1